MKQFWEQLTKRQKYTVIAGITFIALVMVVQFLLLPYLEARQKVRSSIEKGEKTLREMATLGLEFGILRRSSDEIRRVIEQRPQGFALFSYLEKRANDAGVKMNVKSISPMKGATEGVYEEVVVEIKLEKLTMKQLTDFLFLTESPRELIRIRKMSVGKMKESPEYLDAQIQVVTYQNVPAGGQ